MAITTSTLQALDVLNKSLDRNFASREADKNRGIAILQLKIQSDEREADRVNQQLIAMQNRNAAYEENLIKLSGAQAALSGEDGQGAALLNRERHAVSMDIDGMRKQMGSAVSRKNELLGQLGSYYNAFETLAPEKFEKFVATGADKTLTGVSSIGDDEWEAIVKDHEETNGPMSNTQKAGLRRRFDELSKTRLDQEYKERLLGLENYKLKIRKDELDVAKDAAGSKKNNDYFDDLFKQKIDQFNQYAGAISSRNKDHKIMGASYVPNQLPRSVSDVQAIMQESAKMLADWSVIYDSGGRSESIRSIVEKYKKAIDEGDTAKAEKMSYVLYEKYKYQPEQLRLGDFDQSLINITTDRDSPARFYGEDLMKAMDALQGAEQVLLARKIAENPDYGNSIKTAAQAALSQVEAEEVVEKAKSDITRRARSGSDDSWINALGKDNGVVIPPPSSRTTNELVRPEASGRSSRDLFEVEISGRSSNQQEAFNKAKNFLDDFFINQ